MNKANLNRSLACSPRIDHLIGSPLAFASEEYASKAWMRFADIPGLQTPAIKFIQGSATAVDCGKKTCNIRETGTQDQIEVSYDYLIASSGVQRTWPSAPRSLTREEYLSETTTHIEHIKGARDGVVVIGGGMELPSFVSFFRFER